MRTVVAHRTVPFVAPGGIATSPGRIPDRRPVVVGSVWRAIVVGSVWRAIVVRAVHASFVADTTVGPVAAERTWGVALST